MTTQLISRMFDTTAGLAAHASSASLRKLSRKIHKPLDKVRVQLDPDVAAFDAAVDSGWIPGPRCGLALDASNAPTGALPQ